MITRISINGFKSFHHLEMLFTPFTIVAGANASGKSNLFDALELLARLAETDLKTAFLDARRGTPTELFTQLGDGQYAKEMEFEVDMLLDRVVKDNWGGEEKLNHTRLRYRLVIERKPNRYQVDDLYIKHESLEKIKSQDDEWIKHLLPKKMADLAKSERSGGTAQPYIRTEPEGDSIAIKLRQDGKQGGRATRANAATQTVLSAITSVEFRHVLAAKTEMAQWRFLQFNPEDLRASSKKEVGLQDIMSKSGKYLAASLFRIAQTDIYQLTEISRKLQTFLPEFVEVNVLDDTENNQFIIKLKDKNRREYTSRILSEVTLRILALCVLAFDERHTGLLCLEEPENGIHPFKIKDMASLLKELSTDFSSDDTPLRQVIINTHSPVMVREAFRWQQDSNVSIWYAQMKNQVADIEQRRVAFASTSILPVLKDKTTQLPIPYSPQELGLTLSVVEKYLETNSSAPV